MKSTSEQNQIKHALVKSLNETINPDHFSTNSLQYQSTANLSHEDVEPNSVISRSFTKSVKSFVRFSLATEIDSFLKEIKSTDEQTWKIDVHNLSKVLSDHSRMNCMKDNLSNILDSCLTEVDASVKNLNYYDAEIEFSPLLQPEHLVEIAECISADNPLDVRLNALRALLKSHFSEAIDGEGWILLRNKLVNNLCDNNEEVFTLTLKAHAKLASCSSPVALKECTLNLVESLGKHYYTQREDAKLTLDNSHFYRMVHLTALLLNSLREATLNVARFGESRLEETISSLVQLLALHVPYKHGQNKRYVSPLEVVSYLDPHGQWLVNITHFHLTCQLFFNCLCRNKTLLKIVVEEIVSWLLDPVIVLKDVSQGELSVSVSKFSMFCHSLSVFVRICSFGFGRKLFPVSIFIKKEELVSVEDVIHLIIKALEDSKFNDLVATKSTEPFKQFLEENIYKLLSSKDVDINSFLVKIIGNDSKNLLTNTIKLNILNSVSLNESLHNSLLVINNDASLKRKVSVGSNSSVSNRTFASQKSYENTLQETEPKVSLGSQTQSFESVDLHPYELYSRHLMKLNIAELRRNPKFFQIVKRTTKYYKRYFRSNEFKIQLIQHIAQTYYQLQEEANRSEQVFDEIYSQLFSIGSDFFLLMSASSKLFQILEEFKIIGILLSNELQRPIIDWNDPDWITFLTKAGSTNSGSTVLAKESSFILRNELRKLWTIIDEDCSGSDLPVENLQKNLLNIISVLSLSFVCSRAIFSEPTDGSDKTLTDESDVRPCSVISLVQHYVIDEANCPDYIHHQFALKVLEVFTFNIDTSLFLLGKLKYDEILLKLQSDNRVEDNPDVIIDECSLTRHRIIEQTYLPGRVRADTKPTHLPPRPESTFSRTKLRSRGTGEFTRWLSETKSGLHDHNWLKHARKLYRNSNPDEVKGSIIIDLIEQVIKVFPFCKNSIDWTNLQTEERPLELEDQLAIQLVVRFGTHHRLIQPTQQNVENLTQITLLAKSVTDSNFSLQGYDWFVATVYLLCSGSIEKVQSFLSQIFLLPTASLLWMQNARSLDLAQIGDLLDSLVAEEMPTLHQGFRNAGFSSWQLFYTWISQCWWNILDWTQICHWIILSILYQPDHQLYFCLAILHANHDYLLRMTQDQTIHELILNPVEKFNLINARTFMDRLHKKYHNSLSSHLAFLNNTQIETTFEMKPTRNT